MWRSVVVLMLAACGFPNRDAAEHPTEPLEFQKPAREDDSAQLRGVVHTGDEMFPTPVQFVSVELVRGDRVMHATTTDHDGRFEFAADVPNATYDVRLAGEYIGSTKVVWSGHARDGLVIRAQRR